MPVTQFEQPTGRVGGRVGRGRAGLVVWGAGLVVIVGLAVAGRAGGPPAPAEAVAASAAPASAVAPPDAVLVLTDPGRETVSSVALRVRGRAADGIASVELVLLRDEQRLGTQTVEPTGSGLFAGVFTMRPPRPAGTVTIMAIGRDRDGLPVVQVRHEATLAALSAAAAAGATVAAADRPVRQPPTVSPRPRPAVGQWPVGRLGWQVNPAQL